MATDDWLVGRDRHSEAAERICAAAADMMSRQGYDAFSIDALAATVHCSPATIYRHTGGKAAIRDAVMGLQAERILDSVREAIIGLTGPERIITAATVALQRLRADPLAQIMPLDDHTPRQRLAHRLTHRHPLRHRNGRTKHTRSPCRTMADPRLPGTVVLAPQRRRRRSTDGAPLPWAALRGRCDGSDVAPLLNRCEADQ